MDRDFEWNDTRRPHLEGRVASGLDPCHIFHRRGPGRHGGGFAGLFFRVGSFLEGRSFVDRGPGADGRDRYYESKHEPRFPDATDQHDAAFDGRASTRVTTTITRVDFDTCT